MTQRKSFREENIRDFDRLETNPGPGGLNVIRKKYTECHPEKIHSDAAREMPRDIDTSLLSFLALRGHSQPAAKCFNP